MSKLLIQAILAITYDTEGTKPEALEEIMAAGVNDILQNNATGSTDAEVDHSAVSIRQAELAEDADSRVARLKLLDEEAHELRAVLKISAPGEIIYQADTAEGVVMVEADGYGGSTVREVEGNFPIDYCTQREQICATEGEGLAVADEWMGDDDDENDVDEDEEDGK